MGDFYLRPQCRVGPKLDADGYELPTNCVIESADAKVLTKTEVKRHLNLDADETHEDDYIDSLIDVATNAIEGALNHSVVQKTAEFYYTGRTGRFKVEDEAVVSFGTIKVQKSSLNATLNIYVITNILSVNTSKGFYNLGTQGGDNECTFGATLRPFDGYTEVTDKVAESNLHLPVSLGATVGYREMPPVIKQVALQCCADLFDNRGQLNLAMAGNMASGIVASGILDQYRKHYKGILA